MAVMWFTCYSDLTEFVNLTRHEVERFYEENKEEFEYYEDFREWLHFDFEMSFDCSDLNLFVFRYDNNTVSYAVFDGEGNLIGEELRFKKINDLIVLDIEDSDYCIDFSNGKAELKNKNFIVD